MWLMHAIAAAWRGLLGATPRPLLRRLDDWARRHAQQRAERRRRLWPTSGR